VDSRTKGGRDRDERRDLTRRMKNATRWMTKGAYGETVEKKFKKRSSDMSK